MSPSFSEYFLMQHSTLGLSSISPALLLVRSFTCLRKVLGRQDLCAMGVSLLLGPLSVYVLLSPFQLEYFLPTRICSEIPLCVWRANYFSVTYTNIMIFFPPSVSFDFGLSFCFILTKGRYLLSIPFSLRISLASKPSQNGEIQVQWELVSQKLKWVNTRGRNPTHSAGLYLRAHWHIHLYMHTHT